MYLPRLLSDSDPVCEEVLSSSCTDLGCDSGIAKEEGVVAFEMEGAGVLDEMPAIVVEGLCDYADCRALRAAAPSRRADRTTQTRSNSTATIGVEESSSSTCSRTRQKLTCDRAFRTQYKIKQHIFSPGSAAAKTENDAQSFLPFRSSPWRIDSLRLTQGEAE
ncbi:hypothetical protein Purlil1_3386 [Purpureocillium lilacinum]|uniref:C2H2-type domain-containing protein n=1 Tax=Purpureocillium lilacinum TaxID=33203 RepID=A0ABR0C8R3_PURLI|nr:hypothetical protein Purlil1_3386 [Purpureocillium lilacinum]